MHLYCSRIGVVGVILSINVMKSTVRLITIWYELQATMVIIINDTYRNVEMTVAYSVGIYIYIC